MGSLDDALSPLLQGDALKHRLSEKLLAWTLPDLEQRSRPDADFYETLGLAAILRRTLTDKHPVVNSARARLRLPGPIFEFTPFDVPPPSPPGHGLTPMLALAGDEFTEPTERANLRRFLSTPAGHLYSEPVSVRDMIDYFANVNGAVHLGKPKSRFEEVVQQFVVSTRMSTSLWTGTLRHIAIVSIRALRPLIEQIEANPPESIPLNAEQPRPPRGEAAGG
ncbi:hypothetical protein [Microbacterium sp. NPDC080220]|uniref:hypothetical protein n=1 Tax=Microbacterium sp. NPDC080220 TaxID=3161017 RepID=UPI003417A6F2